MVLRRPVTLWSWNHTKSISTMQTDQPPPMLQADWGVAIKDSKTTPQKESNLKMLLLPEPVCRFISFHLDLSV
jgi:hypothetical protein